MPETKIAQMTPEDHITVNNLVYTNGDQDEIAAWDRIQMNLIKLIHPSFSDEQIIAIVNGE